MIDRVKPVARTAPLRLVLAVAAVSFAASIASTTAAGVAATSSTIQPPGQAPATADRFPEGPGKSVLLRVCGNCHDAETAVERLKSRPEWSDTVDQMARFGAEASDAEFEQILNYLAKFYSPIRINKATAKELENTLDIPAAAAEAIVAYRTEKGPFATIEDLKPVPGLEWAKVEERKARLVFTT